VPLRLDADGIHRLTVHLHPADLGPVSLVAEIRDGTVSLQLSGSTEAGRESLRAALPDLRRELIESGFGKCDVDLRQDGEQARQQQLRPPLDQQTPRIGPDRADQVSEAPVPVRDNDTRRLDVQL
jgi:flagellar hook-length control protein FliK